MAKSTNELGVFPGILRLLGPARVYRRIMAPVLLAAVLVQMFALIAPMLSHLIVDHSTGLAAQAEGIYVVIGYGLVLATAAFSEFIRAIWVNALTARLELDSYPRAFGAAFGGHDRTDLQRSASEVISRFNSLRTTQQLLGNIVVEGIVDLLFVLTMLTALFFYDRTIASVALLSVMIYLLVRLGVGRALKGTARDLARIDATQVAYLKDEADAHQSIRFFRAHQSRLETWRTLVGQRVTRELRRNRITAHVRLVQQLSIGAISMTTLSIGSARVGAGELTLGAMFALVGLTYAMFTRVTLISERLSSIDYLDVHWRRFSEIAPRREAVQGAFMQHLPLSDHTRAGLSIHSLRVRFAARQILDVRDIHFPANKLTVVTGASGEGKSTLIRALAGLIETENAEIIVCGLGGLDEASPGDRQHLDVTAWSTICAASFQGDALFDQGSYLENISCYDSNPCAARAERAARLACVDDEIVTKLGGYGALVYRGALSEGQAQRLLLARALYRSPKVLLLDEATSALDEQAERDVIRNIRSTGATVVAVAHRRQWIEAADHVLELSAGELSRVQGDHWKIRGKYAA